VKNDSNIKPKHESGTRVAAAGFAGHPKRATSKASTKTGCNLFDTLGTFERSFTWINREFKKLRRQKQPPAVKRALRELAARNHQLGGEVLRFMEE
jgi:hypothetical protein